MKAIDSNLNVAIKSEMTANELLAIANMEMPTLLDPILPKVGVASLVGSSDTGKSSFLRQLALAIVQGRDEFIGHNLECDHESAIYVSTEDEQNALGHLLAKQLDVLDVIEEGKTPQSAELDNLQFIFDTEGLLENLEKKLSNKPADCIVIDAFSDVFSGSINTSNDVRTFLQQYADLARKHQCLVIFLHHNGKRTQYGTPHKDDILGSQGFEAKMRAILNLSLDKYNDSLRNLCVVKHNYLPEEEKSKVTNLKFGQDLNFSFSGTSNLESLSKKSGPTKVDQLLKNNYPIIDRLIHAKDYTYKDAEKALNEGGVDVSRGTLAKAVKARKNGESG
ncbi:AAA family ATPase [Fodinibius sp. AD559]|uniref:AAA family ATPase n=1 Tax=Fodinibius sp. AD559 TaxID=3424179 RepID=UPI004046C262